MSAILNYQYFHGKQNGIPPSRQSERSTARFQPQINLVEFFFSNVTGSVTRVRLSGAAREAFSTARNDAQSVFNTSTTN